MLFEMHEKNAHILFNRLSQSLRKPYEFKLCYLCVPALLLEGDQIHNCDSSMTVMYP